MRYPRVVFVASILTACLLLDFLVGQTTLSIPSFAPARLSASSVPAASVPTQGAGAPVAPKASLKISNDPPPAVSPPNFGAADKPQGLLPPPSSFSELPEPHFTTTGLVLMNFSDASQWCNKQNKRLPTTLEAARWAARNGASMTSVQEAKKLNRESDTNAIYSERTEKTKAVDFYFEKASFSYPAQRPITNAAIWTSDKRALGGTNNASHYAFSMYEAYFSPVPESSSLAVVCMANT